MKCKSKIALLLILMVIVTLVLNSVAFATTNSCYLNIDGVKQEQTYWCWAATSETIIKFLGHGAYSQSTIVQDVKGSVVNDGASYSEDGLSLTKHGVSTTGTQSGILGSGNISFSTIKTMIQGWSSPIKACIAWNTGGYHDLVIYGFYEDSSTQNVSYMDPWQENPMWNSRTYSSFVSNSGWNWGGWTYYNNQ